MNIGQLGRRLREFLRRRYINKRYARAQVESLFRALLFYGGVMLVLLLTQGIVNSSFPPSITHELSLEILRSLIEVDGFLIGFMGAIMVYVFSSIRSVVDMAVNPRDPEDFDEVAVEAMSTRRTNVSWISALTVLSLVFSILAAFSAMARLTGSAQPSDFYPPLAMMFEGIAGIFWMISQSV